MRTWGIAFWLAITSAPGEAPDAGADRPTTQVPFTYILHYDHGQIVDPAYVKRFDEAPPELYHPGHNVRFLGHYGVGAGIPRADDGPGAPTPEAQRKWLARVRQFTDDLHARGVRWITPYLCNQTITGDPKARSVFWELFDRWESFSEYDLGPRPNDPLDLMQRNPEGRVRYNYRYNCFMDRRQSDTIKRYAPCLNNPSWRRLCNVVMRNMAECGFDGAFIDNCILHCYCDHCQAAFRKYLAQRYPGAKLQEAFGASSVEGLSLYAAGDHIHWARSFDGFIPYLEANYEPARRRIDFDTKGPLDAVHLDYAGGGNLGGMAEGFIRSMLADKGDPRALGFEETRLANPALQTPRGQLLWAETKRFWSESAGEQLEAMQDAGREARPGYFLIPNWGTLRRVVGAAGRSETGHDLARWRRGGEIQLYEENLASGLVAPGVVLDFALELKFAFANRVRAVVLSQVGRTADALELATAEASAAGGSVFGQHAFIHPRIRADYRAFYKTQGHLYRGYRSPARVALAYLFDQAYYNNVEHLRQVSAISRHLLDQQIPFDVIIESDLTPKRLRNYDVVIAPEVSHFDDAWLAVVAEHVRAGGHWIVTGQTGRYDTLARPRKVRPAFLPETSAGAASSSTNGVAHFAFVEALLGGGGMRLERAIQVCRGGRMRDVFRKGTDGSYEMMAEMDRLVPIRRNHAPSPLSALIEKQLGRRASLIDPVRGSGLRTWLWERIDGDTARVVVHVVNYNVPLTGPEESRVVRVARDVELAVPLPAGFARIVTARLHEPGQAALEIKTTVGRDGLCVVKIPEMRILKLVELELGRPD